MSSGLLRRFLILDGLIVVAGVVIALYADRPSDDALDYADAWREIGGALVAGGVVAGVVLWFEELREDERVGREVQRDNRAETKAWRRELDIQLIRLVNNELEFARRPWIYHVGVRALHPDGLTSDPAEWQSTVDDFTEQIAAVTTVLAFLRDEDLDECWNVWRRAAHVYQYGKPSNPLQSPPELGGGVNPRSGDELFLSEVDEQAEWDAFLQQVDRYRDMHYPLA